MSHGIRYSLWRKNKVNRKGKVRYRRLTRDYPICTNSTCPIRNDCCRWVRRRDGSPENPRIDPKPKMVKGEWVCKWFDSWYIYNYKREHDRKKKKERATRQG